MAYAYSPEELGPLCDAAGSIMDDKLFVDAEPRMPAAQIRETYDAKCGLSDFDLHTFIGEHFHVSPTVTTDADPAYLGQTPAEHIGAMWPLLTRKNQEDNGTLIGLEHAYVSASVGPYFQEQYYWDTFFTNLGLWESGQYALARGQVRNLADMIERFGYAPNGNRTYYTRTQDPLFAMMVADVTRHYGDEAYLEFLPALLLEDEFFRRGEDELAHAAGSTALNRLVRMPDGELLDRVYCDSDAPRPERRRHDIDVAARDSTRPATTVYRDINAGAGTGRDFFSGLLKDGQSLHTIHTTDLVSVQRNSFRVRQQRIIADALEVAASYADSLEARRSLLERAAQYSSRADHRATALNKYCWNEKAGFLFDYDFVTGEQKKTWHLGAAAALYADILSQRQGERMGEHLERAFLRPGGYAASLHGTEHMWDGSEAGDLDRPAYGWAPDQYTAFHGLRLYGQNRRAYLGAQRWVAMNDAVYANTGRMYENYDVNSGGPGHGGEKPVQTGFGWTNGVYLHFDRLVRKLLDKAA